MNHVGPAPYLAGLACKESRRLMEQSYAKPIHRPTYSAASSAIHWIDLQKTVVSLEDYRSAGALSDAFTFEDLARFRHVVLQSSRFSDLFADSAFHLPKLDNIEWTNTRNNQPFVPDHGYIDISCHQTCSKLHAYSFTTSKQ
ncbi:hypothetical protein BDP67DRAFT_519152 [Colletotrichum lupini]|nr:hypothetical protein BDP67DRAFT_519152 [Colletotrichum lupini]